jgi:Protein of unknown function (DUF3775)
MVNIELTGVAHDLITPVGTDAPLNPSGGCSGSNASDDGMLSVLEDHSDDPVRTELTAIIRGLNEDEQIDLVALTWLGRGDGELDDWDDIRAEASRAHNKRTAEYLLGIPLLGDLLEEGLAQFGHSIEEFEQPV